MKYEKPLSSYYTLGDAIARVLSKVNVGTPKEKPLIGRIVNEINQRQLSIARRLWKEEEDIASQYEVVAEGVTGSTYFDKIEEDFPPVGMPLRVELERKVAAIDTAPDLKEAVNVKKRELPYVGNFTDYNNKIICCFEGRKITIVAGEENDTSNYNMNFVYLRKPNFLSLRSDKIDIPDDYYDELINTVTEVFAAQVNA